MSNKIYIGTPTSSLKLTQISSDNEEFLCFNNFTLIKDPRVEFMEYTRLLGSGKPWLYIVGVSNLEQLEIYLDNESLPPGILQDVVEGDCTLIVYNYSESNLDNYWMPFTRNLFEKMINVYQIPAHKIKWISNGIGTQEAFDAYCEKQNVWNPGVKHIPFLEFLIVRPAEWHNLNFPRRKFIYLQKIHRHHRIALAMWMHKHNIDSYMSHHVRDNTTQKVSEAVEHYKSLDLNSHDIKNFLCNLPMEVDGVNLDENNDNHLCALPANNSRITCATERSGIYIVGETRFEDPAIFFSEKTYKPLMLRKPIIFLGQPGSLEALRNLGFKTFDPFIDESYDQISDPQLRIRAVADEIARLNTLDPAEFSKLLGSMEEACEHNFHLLEDFAKNTIDLDKLL